MDMDSDTTRNSTSSSKAVEAEGHVRAWKEESENLEGPPDGFIFVLPFLDLPSRLTMERVSKSLRDAVRNNPLVWQHLHVGQPAVRNLTDDILARLVRRACGQLKSLSLESSLRITEDSLGEILAANLGLEQLSIPWCTGISAEEIVNLVVGHSLRARSRGLPGIKQVQIRGLYNITNDHLARLHKVFKLVGHPQDPPSQVLSPRYYGSGVNALRRYDDARPIDVELCPRCANVRMVYDCTKHWINSNPDSSCQGCTFCIPRCEECGACIRDISHEVSLCSDLLCETCWLGLPKCSECNRAVCGRHVHQFKHPNSNSFTCEDCILGRDNPGYAIYAALYD